MFASRVFAPLMAAAALGACSSAVIPASAAASGSQIYTCQKHGGKAQLASGGKCKSGETKTAWQSATPKVKTSAIYTCKSSSGHEKLVSHSTKCAKHERKLTWYEVKPPSNSGTLGTKTVVPPATTAPPASQTTPPASQPTTPTEPAGPVEAPNFAVAAEQRVKGETKYTTAAVSAEAGETLEYQITVTNTGNTNLTVGAPKGGCTNFVPSGEQPVGVGAAVTYTCTHKAHPTNVPSYGNVADVVAAGKEKASNEVTASVKESKVLAGLKTKLSEAEATAAAAKKALETAQAAAKPIVEAQAALGKAKEKEATAKSAVKQAEEAFTKAEGEVTKDEQTKVEDRLKVEAEEEAAEEAEETVEYLEEEEIPEDKEILKEEKQELREVEKEAGEVIKEAKAEIKAAETALAKAKAELAKDKVALGKNPGDEALEKAIAEEEATIEELETGTIPYWQEEIKYGEEEIALYKQFVTEDEELLEEAEAEVVAEKLAEKQAKEQIPVAKKHLLEAEDVLTGALTKAEAAKAALTAPKKALAEAETATQTAEKKVEEVKAEGPLAEKALEEAETAFGAATTAETAASAAVKAEEAALDSE